MTLWSHPDEILHEVKPFGIKPKSPRKRLRVLEKQFLEGILESLNLSNYDFQVWVFLKQCDLLESRFPKHSNHIRKIRVNFWAKAQEKRKILLSTQKKYRRIKRRMEALRQLVEMRFIPVVL